MTRRSDSRGCDLLALMRSPMLECCALLMLSALGCNYDRVSVGDLACSDDERVLCDPHEPQPVFSTDDPWEVVPKEGVAEVVWKRSFPVTQPPCETRECTVGVEAFLVHDDGEIVLAGVLRQPEGSQLLVTWLDAQGEVVFQAIVPGSGAALRDSTLTQVTLVRTRQGETLLLHGLGMGQGGNDTYGRLQAHTVDRSGEIAAAFAIDTRGTWPGQRALLDSDVIIARTQIAPDVEIARYTRAGEMRWRQRRIASVPGPGDVGLAVDQDLPPQLHALHVDARGRIWGVLYEGVLGIVQLDPDGIVAWHAWTQVFGAPNTSFPTPAGAHLLIDSRDRPVVAATTTVLRLEPDGSDEQRRTALMHHTAQEFFYPPVAHSLALDALDRIYIGTQDGPRSNRRIVIDRIPEDLSANQRFALPNDGEHAQTGEIRHMQVAPDGDVYVHVHGGAPTLGTPSGLSGAGNLEAGALAEFHSIARLRLSELAPTR